MLLKHSGSASVALVLKINETDITTILAPTTLASTNSRNTSPSHTAHPRSATSASMSMTTVDTNMEGMYSPHLKIYFINN